MKPHNALHIRTWATICIDLIKYCCFNIQSNRRLFNDLGICFSVNMLLNTCRWLSDVIFMVKSTVMIWWNRICGRVSDNTVDGISRLAHTEATPSASWAHYHHWLKTCALWNYYIYISAENSLNSSTYLSQKSCGIVIYLSLGLAEWDILFTNEFTIHENWTRSGR